MAAHLREHWGTVFQAKPIDSTELGNWLQQTLHPDDKMNPQGWRINKGHVLRAIKITNDSAPGPDGIPYAAWRAIAHTATPILHAVINDLRRDNWQLYGWRPGGQVGREARRCTCRTPRPRLRRCTSTHRLSQRGRR